jgi:Kef-type K+ transport system membrane component KefB/mannitol/fructose-specific phosphotransferase system IIA component
MFLGTAVAISAMAVIARVLHDLDILKSDIGLTIISAVTVNDVLGWVAFTIVLGLATQQRLDLFSILRICGGATLFIAFSLTLGRKLVHKVAVWINRSRLPKPGSILTFIVLLGGLCAVISQMIGIHAALGFFFAGVMAGDSHAISERSRQTISQMVYAVFVPLFFVSIGLRLDFVAYFDWLPVLSITAVAMGGKLFGAWVGARASAIPRRDSFAIGMVFIPGGAMEILIGVLALEFGLINLVVFEAIVVAALVSSIAVGPLLSLALGLRRAFNALEFFLKDAVVANLKGSTPFELIGELCGSISEHEGMPGAAKACAAVRLREGIMGTGMEKGIAIPHARMEDLARPVFTFGRSSKGVEWNTADGLPARLVFLILTPDPDKDDLQVKILASIARVMEDEKARREMLEARDRKEMTDIFSAALRRDRMMRAKG